MSLNKDVLGPVEKLEESKKTSKFYWLDDCGLSPEEYKEQELYWQGVIDLANKEIKSFEKDCLKITKELRDDVERLIDVDEEASVFLMRFAEGVMLRCLNSINSCVKYGRVDHKENQEVSNDNK